MTEWTTVVMSTGFGANSSSADNLTTALPVAPAVYEPTINIRTLHHYNEILIFVVSLVINPTLAVLILTEKNPALRAYTRVLLQNCVVDFIYTVVCIVTEMQIEFKQGYMIFTVNSALKSLPMKYHYILMYFYVLFCGLAIDIVPVMFYFRYMLVCRGEALSHLKLAITTAIPTGAALLQAYFMISGLLASEANRPELCRRLLNHPIWWEPGTRQPTVRCMMSSVTDPHFSGFVGGAIVLDNLLYAIMMYTSYAIYRHLKMNAVIYSDKTSKLQRQMNRILFAQFIMPIFTAVIPTGVIIVCALLRTSVVGSGIGVAMAYAWVPIISPITTIWLVSSFRRRLWRTVGRLLKCVSRRHRAAAPQSTSLHSATASHASHA